MAIAEQKITDRYAVYNGDCIEVLPGLKDESVDMSIYSPPFADLYNYSSSENDMSNCRNYGEFMEHYEFLVKEIFRVTKPGRLTCVHSADTKIAGTNSAFNDFPGDIIRIHQRNGFHYQSRHCIWKEPLRVAIRTRALGLMHRQIVKDSSMCHAAGADYLLIFRKHGANKVPITHPEGILKYAGEREIPNDLVARFGTGDADPKVNKLAHWIWQQYASSMWDDVRVSHVLPYKAARDSEEEKHVCPLQLDVIERAITLYTNAGEVVMTPFMGVGSEVYTSLELGRRAIGVELKGTYFKQALRNIESLNDPEQVGLFETEEEIDEIEEGRQV